MVLHHNKLISCTYHWLSPGIDQRDTPGETPGTCGHFEKNLPCRVGTFVGFWNKRAGPQDSPTGCVWLWSALRLFQSPEWTWRWVTLLQFVWHFVELFSVCYMFVLQFFIMPLYKAWDVLRRKRKSVIADSFDEFVVKGELNSISSDFVVSEHTFLIF